MKIMEIKPVYFHKKSHVVSRQCKHVPSHSVEFSDNVSLEQKIIATIRTVYDPEIHVNVYDLGLIYRISINDDAEVEIEMTLTAPACPVAEILPAQVAAVIKSVDEVRDVKVNLVWDPPWSQTCISEAARLELGLL